MTSIFNIRRNPEFVRYARERLRHKYLIVGLSIVIAIAVIFGAYGIELTSTSYNGNFSWSDVGASVFYFLLGVNFVILWGVNTLFCAQSVGSEKAQKTYDFQLMTRLTPSELMLGKLFGAPVVGYVIAAIFAFSSCLVLVVCGGIPLSVVLTAYILLLVAAIALNSFGLLFSTYVEKAWVFGLVMMGLFFAFAVQLFVFSYSTMNRAYGYAADTHVVSVLNPFGTISNAVSKVHSVTNIFGIGFPSLLAQTGFYFLCSAILLYAISLRIKQTRERLMKYHLFWLLVFLHVMILSFLWPPVFNTIAGQGGYYSSIEIQYARINYLDIFGIYLAISTTIIYLLSLGFIGTWHDMNIWLRKQATDFVGKLGWWMEEKALPLFMAITLGVFSIALFTLVYLFMSFSSSLQNYQSEFFLICVAFLLFIVRDIGFLCAMRFTKSGRNLGVPVLFLGIFYLIGSILTAIFVPEPQALLSTIFPLTIFTSYADVQAHAGTIILVLAVEAFFVLMFFRQSLKTAKAKALQVAQNV